MHKPAIVMVYAFISLFVGVPWALIVSARACKRRLVEEGVTDRTRNAIYWNLLDRNANRFFLVDEADKPKIQRERSRMTGAVLLSGAIWFGSVWFAAAVLG